MGDEKMPADGGGVNKGRPDGVAAAPNDRPESGVHGRETDGTGGGGESGGGAYPNPQTGKTPTNDGMMGHGGQTNMDYHGGGQAGGVGDAPNAAAGSGSSDGVESGAAAAPSAERQPRQVTAGGRSFEVTEESGIADAEAHGKIGTDSDKGGEESAGSG